MDAAGKEPGRFDMAERVVIDPARLSPAERVALGRLAEEGVAVEPVAGPADADPLRYPEGGEHGR